MRLAVVIAVAVLLAACTVPRDPEGTLERVTGGVIRAGYTQAPPWASGSPDDPTGVEIDLVEGLAQELGATVEWTEASQADLFTALEAHALDIVVGGFDATDPHVLAAGATRPYATTTLTVGVPNGDPVPQTLEGLTIVVEEGTEAFGLVEKAGATAEPVATLPDAPTKPTAVDDWLLDDLGLVDSDLPLAESKHAMAVPLGENGWLVEVERYLFRSAADIDRAITDSGPA